MRWGDHIPLETILPSVLQATVCTLSPPTGDLLPVVTPLRSCTRAPSVSFAEESAVLPCDVVLTQVAHTVATGPVVAPPPETPPVILPPPDPPPIDLPDILDCLPPEDHAAFATRFIIEELDARRYSGPAHQSLGVVVDAARLVVPQQRPSPPLPPPRPGLVQYAIPMDKARPHPQSYIPQGAWVALPHR